MYSDVDSLKKVIYPFLPNFVSILTIQALSYVGVELPLKERSTSVYSALTERVRILIKMLNIR